MIRHATSNVIFAILACLLLFPFSPLSLPAISPSSFPLTQTPQLELSLRRDWGYSGFAGDIQGTFTMKVEGPEDLVSVDFYIDDQRIGVDTEPPWRLRFVTDDYPLGMHELRAVGHTAAGETLVSNTLKREFAPASRGWAVALKIIIPVILFSLLIGLIAIVIERKRGKTRRGYGFFGGAVCPHCGYPFARHWWAPNLGTMKYDRCPNCGRWSRVGLASADELARAEAAFFGQEEAPAATTELSDEEKLRRRLEESRYEDF